MFISVPNLPWLPEEHCLQAMVSRADAVQILLIKVVKDLALSVVPNAQHLIGN
jgi:hypothetical protein